MKKLFLTIALFFICSTAQAATTWYACSGGGTWAASNWTSIIGDEVGCTAATGHPVAGDTAILNANSGNITIGAAAAAATIDETGYTGTLAFGTQTLTLTAASNIGGAMTSTSGTISTGGNITLLSTATGTFPALKFTGAASLISGGFTWPGALNLGVAGNVTLNGNAIITGLVTYSAATNLIVTTSETLTANGGLTMTSASGTTGSLATIILGGGTWSGTNQLTNSLTLAGNVTVSGNVNVGGGTLTYSSGTITVTGSTVTFGGAETVNTGGMKWNNITTNSNGPYTLTSNLNMSGTLNTGIGSYIITFAGAYNISCGTWLDNTISTSYSISLVAGQTLNITNDIDIKGDPEGTYIVTVKSTTASSPTYINYTGPLNKETVLGITFTDVSATGPTVKGYGPVLFNYNGKTLTRTSGIVNVTAANINKKPINYANTP